MSKLFLINTALYAALIMAAATIVVRHWRRSRGRPLMRVRRGRGAVTEPTGEATAPGEIAAAPRLVGDSRVPGSGTNLPAAPQRPPAAPQRPPAAPQRPPAAPQKPAESKVPEAPSVGPGPRSPEAEPDGPQGDARAATGDEPIISYYEHADRPMADYLEALGWIHEPDAHEPGAADAEPASELEEAAGPGRRAPPAVAARADLDHRAHSSHESGRTHWQGSPNEGT